MDNLPALPPTANKNIPITAIINYANLGLTTSEIAKQVGCSKTNIINRLEAEGFNRQFVLASRKAEAETITYAQQKLLNGIIEEAEKAPFQSKVYAYGVLFDKRQLLEGRATSITGFEGLDDNGMSVKLKGLFERASKIGLRITEIVGELPRDLRDKIPGSSMKTLDVEA